MLPSTNFIFIRVPFLSVKVIQYVTAYQPLLTAIKAEYEHLIGSVRQGHQNASFLRAQIETLASQPTTIANYRRRCAQLEAEMERISNENARLKLRAKDIQAAIQAKHEENEAAQRPLPKVVNRDRRLLPGEEALDSLLLPAIIV